MLSLKCPVSNWFFNITKHSSKLLLPVLPIVLSLYTPVATANINGSDTQNFNPTASGMDFVSVSSSRTLGAGNFSLGLFLDHAINTLPYFDDSLGTSNDDNKGYNDSITSASLHLSYGVLSFWDLGISFPGVIYQSVKNGDDYHGQFETMGVTDIRLSSKFSLWNNSTTGLALLFTGNFNQIEHNPFSGLKSQPTFNAEIIADTKISDFTLSGNIGYRFRSNGKAYTTDSGDKPIDPVKSELIASTALQYQIPDTKTQLIGELYGSRPGNDFSKISPRSSNILELNGGIRHYYRDDIALHIGAGSEIIHGVNTPDFRVYTGITWTPKENTKIQKQEVAPLPPATEARIPDKIYVIRDILFKFNSSLINKNAAQKNLSTIGEALISSQRFDKLIIEGHTCSIGNEKYNEELSRKRAASIKEWLVHQYRIPESKIIAVGFGEDRPIATNKTPKGRKLNRRVEFKIYYNQRLDESKTASKTE